jgi:hypothetical protein
LQVTINSAPPPKTKSVVQSRFLAAFLIWNSLLAFYVFSSPYRLKMTVEMSSTVASTAQLFFDTGAGYNEGESRVAKVSPGGFEALTFDLPHVDIVHLRFDPLMQEGRVVIRNVVLSHDDHELMSIPAADILPLNQIANRIQGGDEVGFLTTPAANDPGVTFVLKQPLSLKSFARREQGRLLLTGEIVFLVFAVPILIFRRSLSRLVVPPIKWLNGHFNVIAEQISTPDFMRFDAAAIWFYAFCLLCFFGAVAADLNSSSIDEFPTGYGHGARQKLLLGTAQPIRSDEWAYLTPAILNQVERHDRLATEHTSLGGHSVGLMGDIPTRHFSTVFRPQFWSFFVLPEDYAFSAYWQFKALLLVGGLFTWLLLITRSTFWSAAGALWYFFSPFTQWTYSWGSALPEMTGLICLAMVFACYLTVGRNRLALALCALAFAGCSIDFALCAYVPHLVPLFWLAVFFFVAWSIANRQTIFVREAAWVRIAAAGTALALIAAVGTGVYLDLREAIAGIANTTFPGKRVNGGATLPRWELLSNFFAWWENDKHLPPVLNNICEGSGFLWLAPFTLLCVRRMKLSRVQKLLVVALWACALFLLAWILIPFPVSAGTLFGLDRTYGPRCLPPIGLANIALVCLCMASLKTQREAGLHEISGSGYFLGTLGAVLFFYLLLRTTNAHMDSYFSKTAVIGSAVVAAAFVTLLVTGRKRLLALSLVVSQALMFGTVNPLERGIGVFMDSTMRSFIKANPNLLDDKWIVFSGSIVGSGYLAAEGCDVYTGERYVPDVDHFALFASRKLDVETFNRLGFLVAIPQAAELPTRFEMNGSAVVSWYVAPDDPLLRQIGIRYEAFDGQPPPPELAAKLIPLSDKAVDGFWLYRVP